MADRQADGVQAEVVAELVGEHAGELARGQLVEGERRDDDEVAAAGEGVELVARQDAQDVAVGRQVVGDGEVAPQRREAVELAARSGGGRRTAA